MVIRSNAHTHCQFDDGKSSAQEMVQSALDKGFYALGFSAHSPLDVKHEWAVPSAGLPRYAAEIERLKALYQDRLTIRVGLEFDLCSAGLADPASFEYIIGAVHRYVDPASGTVYDYDESPEAFTRQLHDAFHSDSLALARAYYDDMVRMEETLRPPILAHFDLITKFNAFHHLYEPASPGYAAYLDIARGALEACARHGAIFEVNTGAMARGYAARPYPQEALLLLLKEKNVPVMINSDCHSAPQIDHAFAQTASYLSSLGFQSVMVLGRRSLFEEIPLDIKG